MISALNLSQVSGAIFGSASPDSIFGASTSAGGVSAQQAAAGAVDAAQREIKRIRGYKPRLTPAELDRLAKIQEKVLAIEAKAFRGTVRPDELKDRADLLNEADIIIGKPVVDVEADTVLSDLNAKIETLLAPRLSKPDAARLERLTALADEYASQLAQDPTRIVVRQRLQSVSNLIDGLTVPRPIHDLSPSERRQYDELVEQVNSHAGAKLELNARESIRVFNLERSINELAGSLPPDATNQPTAFDVARAYARL
jgi:hypothetical protein